MVTPKIVSLPGTVSTLMKPCAALSAMARSRSSSAVAGCFKGDVLFLRFALIQAHARDLGVGEGGARESPE